MKGRKPAPAAMRARQLAVAGVIDDPPECPEFLSSRAREEWDRLLPRLLKCFIITPLDAAALATFCEIYSQWRRCVETINSEGVTIRDRFGETKPHPLLKQANAASVELRRLAGEFGLTLASRARMDTIPSTTDSPLSEFLE